MASEAEQQPSSEKVGHSGGTGWEALIPLDWDRLRHLTNEPVPQHLKRWWFSLGGTPAYLFLIQITTGILLTFYYQPGSEAAYESVRRITYEVPFGWFLRSVHMWSSNLMIVTVILHLLRVFFTRSYRHPRTLNWVFGVGLLLLTLSMGFTGYSLVYEQLSFWGATVATNLTESVPLVGPALAAFIRGGPDVGSGTMTRLFLLHIGLLPALMIGVLGLHLTFVRLHGVTEYEFERDEASPKRRGALVAHAPRGVHRRRCRPGPPVGRNGSSPVRPRRLRVPPGHVPRSCGRSSVWDWRAERSRSGCGGWAASTSSSPPTSSYWPSSRAIS